MRIHYVENDWGHKMPIHYVECCEVMNRLISFEDRPSLGFWFDHSDGKLYEFQGGRRIRLVEKCPHCNTVVEKIRRELKVLE